MPVIVIGVLLILSGAAVVYVVRELFRRGDAALTEPHCAKCNYDLRGFSAAPPTRCPECGADLTARYAVRWGERRSRKRGLLVGAIMVPLLAALWGAAVVLSAHVRVRTVASAPPVFMTVPAQQTPVLLATLPSIVNQPWGWQELDRRLSSGSLSQADVAQAIRTLITYRLTLKQPEPLTWSEQFVQHADAAGLISDQQYQQLAKTFYKPATIQLPLKVRQGAMADLQVDFADPWQPPGMQRLKALTGVQDEAQHPPMLAPAWRPNDDPTIAVGDLLSCRQDSSIRGKFRANLAPGPHTLRFTIESAIVPQGAAPKLLENYDFPGQPSRWPASRGRWTDQVTVSITVVPADQSPLQLVHDPQRSPSSAISLKNLRLVRNGKRVRLLAEVHVDHPQVTCALRVRVDAAGQSLDAGRIFVRPDEGFGFSLHADVPQPLPGDVEKANVVLEPAPQDAEGVIGADRVWDEPITLLNLPLQRYDLPTTQPAP